MRKLFAYLFDCTHAHTTFPQARKDRLGRVMRPVHNYVVCLDCGSELDHTLFDHESLPIQPRTRGLLATRLLKSVRD